MQAQDVRLSYGLDPDTVARRFREAGPNDLVPQRRSGALLTWLVRILGDPMVILLAIAGATYFVLGDRLDGTVVLVAVGPIFLVGAILEYRSDRALERLNDISPLHATVVRNGDRERIPAREVVPGDVLVVAEGDVVAADATLIESRYLQIDERSLTGESLPVEKHAGAAVLAGTVVRSGSGAAVVDRTGSQTEYGHIARELAKLQLRRTPIEQSIRRLVVQVGIAVGFVCLIVLGVQRLHGDAWAAAIISSVSLAMAAIPEELPMVYTLYLALGAFRLAKHHALVRRLSSVETLGSTSVICVDKTGTLTHGQLEVESLYAADRDNARVLHVAVVTAQTTSNDALDRALLAHVDAMKPRASGEYIPFDPQRLWSGMVLRDSTGVRIFAKGAFEALAARAKAFDREAFDAFIHQAAERGSRVIAVAQATGSDARPDALGECRFEMLGLIAFGDPVREAAQQAIATCRAAGIRFIMLTGDHPATARSIAVAVGLDASRVISRDELQSWTDEELLAHLERAAVFARVRPEDKLLIVRALHARREIVAMTGDGTNDALALKEADIGVAMGKTGTEVARAAADLVLLDDDVATIVRAVSDGRRIFHNLRHAFSYLNAFHAPLLLSAFLLPLFGVPILLLPIHLIWLELIVHPTSALVFEGDPPEPELMEQGPRPASEGLLRRSDVVRALTLGVVLSTAVLALYMTLLHIGYGEWAARGAALVTMIVGQVALVFVERAGRRSLWRVSLKGNTAAAPVIGLTLLSIVAAFAIPPVATILHLAAPPLGVLLASAGIGLAAVLWTQPYYALRERMHA